MAESPRQDEDKCVKYINRSDANIPESWFSPWCIAFQSINFTDLEGAGLVLDQSPPRELNLLASILQVIDETGENDPSDRGSTNLPSRVTNLPSRAAPEPRRRPAAPPASSPDSTRAATGADASDEAG
jgi:hypothetical protein